MDSLASRLGRAAFEPASQQFYSVIAANPWCTNVPFFQASKLTVRHIFDFGKNSVPSSPRGELWAFPAAEALPHVNGYTNGHANRHKNGTPHRSLTLEKQP